MRSRELRRLFRLRWRMPRKSFGRLEGWIRCGGVSQGGRNVRLGPLMTRSISSG